jgi:hypothetical protein
MILLGNGGLEIRFADFMLKFVETSGLMFNLIMAGQSESGGAIVLERVFMSFEKEQANRICERFVERNASNVLQSLC